MRAFGKYIIFQLNTMDMHIFKLNGDLYTQEIFFKFERNATEYVHIND